MTVLKRQIALPRDIKWTNRQKVLNILKTGEPVSASEIHEQTGLSRPTVMKALQEYCETGIVRSVGLGNTTSLGGKKPELFVFSDPRKLLSISIWPDVISLAVSGLTENTRRTTVYPQHSTSTLPETFDRLEKITGEYLQGMGLSERDLYAVALNVPGAIDYENMILRYNVKEPQWGTDIDITVWLRKIFPHVPVFYLDNAGKAVGRELLSNTEYAEIRLLTLFTTWGISACMIDRGHVLNGSNSLIGEIGHMIIDSNATERCVCGKRGCLESLVSINHVKKLLANEGVTAPQDLSIRKIFELSAAGSQPYQNISAYLAHCFAVALHNLSVSYNQEAVVFQGDFARADKVFDTCLKRELKEFMYFPESEPFPIYYDRRDLLQLAAAGDIQRMKNMYFTTIE